MLHLFFVYTIKTIAGAVEKVERSPNHETIRFITFYNAKDAKKARKGLNQRIIGSMKIEIKFSHWRSGSNPMIHYNIPPRFRQKRLRQA